MQLFKLNDAARLTGANARTLGYWGTTDLIPPTYRPKTRGDAAGYSFRDLVAVRTVVRLREAGVSLQALRRVAEYIRNAKGASDNAEALAGTVLAVAGDDVYAVVGDIGVSALREPGQTMIIAFNLGSVVAEMTDAVKKAA